MKGQIFLLSLLFVGFFASVVLAQEAEIPFQNETQAIQDLVNSDDPLSYLEHRWTEFLLGNPTIASIDYFFQKINIVFLVLLSEPYSFSLRIFLISLLWLFFFLSIHQYLYMFSSQASRWGIALAGATILSWIKFYSLILSLIGTLLFTTQSTWWRIVNIFVFFIGLWIIYWINRLLGAKLAESYKAKKEKEREIAGKKIEKITEGIEEE